jgi:hypothetical protein
MGNQLSVLAHAVALKLEMREIYGIQTNIQVRHRGTRHFHLKRLDRFDFFQADNNEYIERHEEQERIFNETELKKLYRIREGEFYNDKARGRIQTSLRMFRELLIQTNSTNNSSHYSSTSSTDESTLQKPNKQNSISVPHLSVESSIGEYLVNKCYSKIQNLFQLDEKCCNAIPDPNESTFVRYPLILPNQTTTLSSLFILLIYSLVDICSLS